MSTSRGENLSFSFTLSPKDLTLKGMSPLQLMCRKVIKVITSDLTHSQDGYTFWYNLPALGKYSRHAMLARWTRLLIQHCYPTSLIKAMTLASLSPDGIPHKEGAALRAWLLCNVYEDTAELYRAWFALHDNTSTPTDM